MLPLKRIVFVILKFTEGDEEQHVIRGDDTTDELFWTFMDKANQS
jgi:hypothetical protein